MKRRQFNMPLAKAAVMSVLAGVLGLMSGASGISSQIAADPLIGFMLGFTPERRAGTALLAAVVAAVAAVGGAMATSQASVSVELIALLTASAFVGVFLGGTVRQRFPSPVVPRIANSLCAFLAIYVMSQGWSSKLGGPVALPFDWAGTTAGIALFGALVGAVSAATAVPIGILLVPACVLLMGLRPGTALLASLLVAVAAAVLPLLAYAVRGAIDRTIGMAMSVGAALGGGVAGALVGMASLRGEGAAVLLSYGFVAVLVCAWSASKAP
jgi:uncharacterized membrane protein YfcA